MYSSDIELDKVFIRIKSQNEPGLALSKSVGATTYNNQQEELYMDLKIVGANIKFQLCKDLFSAEESSLSQYFKLEVEQFTPEDRSNQSDQTILGLSDRLDLRATPLCSYLLQFKQG